MIAIPEYRLALPAPRIAGLLPAWASPEPSLVTRPLTALTDGEEALLVTLYTQKLSISDGKLKLGEDGERWLPIGQHARKQADMLVSYGYLEKHPSGRRSRWYGMTEDGLLRAKVALKARESDEHQMPLAVSAAQGRINNRTDSTSDRMLVLRWKRQDSLRRLAEELGHQGYVLYHEDGRYSHGEQAFYNLWTREMVLFTSRIGDWAWRLRPGGYFAPGHTSEDVALHMAVMEKAGF